MTDCPRRAPHLGRSRVLYRGANIIEPLVSPSAKVLGFKLSEKLHDEDYKTFTPAIDGAAKSSKVRLLAQFHNILGWDAHALWDDIQLQLATTHCTRFDRVALVGEKTWEKWMAKVCTPFTMANVQYFDAANIDKAWAWLAEE